MEVDHEYQQQQHQDWGVCHAPNNVNGTLMFGTQHQQHRQNENSWNKFLLSTLNDKFASAARHGAEWHCVAGNMYRSSNGEIHTCDATCIRWVYRSDGLKICAISGLCKNSIDSSKTHYNNKTKRRTDLDGEETKTTNAQDALTAAMSGNFANRAPPTKKRSLGASDSFWSIGARSVENSDTDMDTDFYHEEEKTYGGTMGGCHCSGSVLQKNSSYNTCGLHY